MVIALLWIVLGNYIFQKSVRRHFSMTHCHMLFQVIYPDRFFAYDAGMTLFDIIFYLLPTYFQLVNKFLFCREIKFVF